MSLASSSGEHDGSSQLTASARGVLYSCSGEFYVDEAVRSARSSLRHNHLPHVLFTCPRTDSAPELSLVGFEPSGNPYADKIANLRRSPFERTLFLDTDTFVVDEIAHVLDVLDHYDIAVAYAPGYRGLDDPDVPSAFHEFNTGVLAWRASERTDAFMRSWQETYLAWLEQEPFPGARKATRGGRADQPAFRRCAWQHGLRLFVLAPEYNFRLGYPATLVGRVRVIHGEHDRFEELAARVNETTLARSWPPPLPLAQRARRRLRRALGGSRTEAGAPWLSRAERSAGGRAQRP